MTSAATSTMTPTITGVPVVSRGPVVVHTRADLAKVRADLPGPVGVVMTMGALHEGHAALMRSAHTECASVVVSVFVNPLQFGADEDLDRYPRTLEADLALCAAEGVDVVFAPPGDEVYPDGEPQVRLDAGPLGERLEGASRPGHFNGMLTVVNKLLNLTQPDRAYFGEKDFQQLVLVRRMVADLNLPVQIVEVPIVRDADGLALSSRNRYLTIEQRRAAAAIPAAVAAAAAQVRAGGDRRSVAAAARARIEAEPLLRLDRLDLVDAETLTAAMPRKPARLLIAVFAGTTRLIDNIDVSGV
jgi:pantoate--beta-alanine ligase